MDPPLDKFSVAPPKRTFVHVCRRRRTIGVTGTADTVRNIIHNTFSIRTYNGSRRINSPTCPGKKYVPSYGKVALEFERPVTEH